MNLPAFIADVHLGKLARMLRMLGIDTVYRNIYQQEDLLNIAKSEQRILLSRNAALSIEGVNTCLIKDKDTKKQALQVLNHYNLWEHITPFTRCMVCNGLLQEVSKADVLQLLQPKTERYFNLFWQCQGCGHVYWKGAHYDRMLKKIESLREHL